MKKHPIYGCDSIEWKKCNTPKQACVFCGEKMEKGHIELQLKDTSSKKTINLWVHSGCAYSLGDLLKKQNPQLFCGRIKKNTPSGNKRCLLCNRTILKNKKPVAWEFDNSKDDIKLRKVICFHDGCRESLADGLMFPNL